ncbi:hypothetical protein V8C86DRAFT_1269090, partial [Haematococcus lacustris]
SPPPSRTALYLPLHSPTAAHCRVTGCRTQNQTQLAWAADEVSRKLERSITDAFSAMHKLSKELRLSLRTAAYIVALQRIAHADANRGHG